MFSLDNNGVTILWMFGNRPFSYRWEYDSGRFYSFSLSGFVLGEKCPTSCITDAGMVSQESVDSMAQKASFSTAGGMTIGFGGGMAYQKSDLVNIISSLAI